MPSGRHRRHREQPTPTRRSEPESLAGEDEGLEGLGLEGLASTVGTKVQSVLKTATKYMSGEVRHAVKQGVDMVLGKEFGKRDLSFIHIPINFGQSIERVGLNGEREQEVPFLIQPSFQAKKEQNKWNAIHIAKGPGGEIWGQMNPDLRPVSNVTGCNLFQTPQKYWPEDVAASYLSGRRAFGLLRDPYDKIVGEFRQQASGGGRAVTDLKRKEISEREGTVERESQEYLDFYSTCDLNGWVKAELTRIKQGDQFRGNCHLLPQSEYFEHPHGISLAIDNRLLPESFNQAMEDHGYNMRMDSSSIHHNWSCNKLSAWSLDEEAKELIKEVYASDFKLLCKTFGYCDSEELTCMQQLPMMCGGSPYDNPTPQFFQS